MVIKASWQLWFQNNTTTNTKQNSHLHIELKCHNMVRPTLYCDRPQLLIAHEMQSR